MNALKDKSFKFSARVVRLYRYLEAEKKDYVLSKQLLRSGTAIGALYREAEYAESKNDFIHKLGIAQKESNETLYWLELLKETDYLEQEQFDSIYKDAEELLKLLTSILKSSKANLSR